MKIPVSHKNERGVALVISLIFLALLGMLGTTAYVMTSTDLKIGSNYQAGAEAFFDADAGINYAVGQIEAGLKDDPPFTLPLTLGDPMDPSDTNSIDLASLTSFDAPGDFKFEFQAPGLTLVSNDQYQLTCIGTGPNNSTATITARMRRKPVIEYGVFGDKSVDVGNTAGIYSYSSASGNSPSSGTSTGEGDTGSNGTVTIRNKCTVDGDVALGDDGLGTEGNLVDLGGTVLGDEGEDVDRVDPDTLGVVGGDYAAKFVTYSNCSSSTSLPPSTSTNDNCCYYNGSPPAPTLTLPSHCYLDDPYDVASPEALVYDPDSTFDRSVPEIDLGNGDNLTLKGKKGGANYYIDDITLGNSSTLYLDTTHGRVNIFLTGEIDAVTGSNFENTKCTTVTTSPCSDPSNPFIDPSGDHSKDDVWVVGKPGDFSIFANSQSNTDTISIGNDVTFSGFIYAPYMTVRMDNSANIYGAIIGADVVLTNSVEVYFDTDMKDDYTTNDMLLTTWRDVRTP